MTNQLALYSGGNCVEPFTSPCTARPSEEQRFQKLMQEHHYLGALPKISETLWYVASFADQWVALLSFSAAALKCSARDRWIGWHFPNLASRILSLCQNRLPRDWQTVFHHPVVLLETFVDPQQFRGTIYMAANWIYVGDTKGFHRTRLSYRRYKNHAQRPTDTILAQLFCRHSRLEL